MKKILITIVLCGLLTGASFGQYKPYDKPANQTTNNLILGIFNPKNFSMNQSLQVSMLTSRYGNISMTSLTNSMNYKFSDKLNVSADVSLQYVPYANSVFGKDASTSLQNSLSGIYLSRVSLDYKISDNSFIKFEYRNLNSGYYNDYWGNGYYDHFYRDGFFR